MTSQWLPQGVVGDRKEVSVVLVTGRGGTRSISELKNKSNRLNECSRQVKTLQVCSVCSTLMINWLIDTYCRSVVDAHWWCSRRLGEWRILIGSPKTLKKIYLIIFNFNLNSFISYVSLFLPHFLIRYFLCPSVNQTIGIHELLPTHTHTHTISLSNINEKYLQYL